MSVNSRGAREIGAGDLSKHAFIGGGGRLPRLPHSTPAAKAAANHRRSINGMNRVCVAVISRAPAGKALAPPPPPPPSRLSGATPEPAPNPYATLATARPSSLRRE